MPKNDERLPYFPFYVADYLSSSTVTQMTLEEQGAFIRLLCFQWQDGLLPSDLEQLARLCGVSGKVMARLWPALKPAFEEREGGLVNLRLFRERERVEEKRRKLSDAGKRGAKKRWSNAGDDEGATGDPNGVAMPSTESESESESATEADRQPAEGSSLRSSPSDGSVGEMHSTNSCGARLAPLIREVAYLGKGPPPEHRLTRCLSKARQLLDAGYSVEELEDAIRGFRLMVERRDERVRDWISPSEPFTLLAFGRADEQGERLIQIAAHEWRKAGQTEESRTTEPGIRSIQEILQGPNRSNDGRRAKGRS